MEKQDIFNQIMIFISYQYDLLSDLNPLKQNKQYQTS